MLTDGRSVPGTPTEGGIHPRTKLPLGKRLAGAAFNVVYGGTGANTGPTLSSCTVGTTSITIEFNTTLLAGDHVVLNPYNSALNNFVAPPPEVPANIQKCFEAVKATCGNFLHNHSDCGMCAQDPADPKVRSAAWNNTLLPACDPRPINNFHEACHSFFPARLPLRGSLVEVLIGQSGGAAASGGGGADAAFCVEPIGTSTGGVTCPPWAGPPDGTAYDASAGRWFAVDIVSATSSSVTVDLAKLNGTKPAAIRYSWGVFDCCNASDPDLYVGKPCDNACPITSSSNLPANPFIAKLTNGKCDCIAPQVC
eukprot:SAG22_NODE_1501_length_4280_cov_1.812963_1_plen_310_part_00